LEEDEKEDESEFSPEEGEEDFPLELEEEPELVRRRLWTWLGVSFEKPSPH
jgi:hypothetical protein